MTSVIMLVAAEPSGDALGAALAAALRARLGETAQLVGVGGPLMAAQGIDSPFSIGPLAVLGITDAVRIYPLVARRAREVGALAARTRPDLAVFIDSWGFNLRAARATRRASPGSILVKYVAPQVWATRPGRARTLAATVDHLLTIHSFDAPWFEAAGLATTFVGNPALVEDPWPAGRESFRASIGAGPNEVVLLIAPGSRRGEVERLMPPFEAAVAGLLGDRPGVKLVVLAAEAVGAEVAARAASWRWPVTVVGGGADRRAAMAGADVALACSGTITTELAMLGVPMVIGYRLDALTAVIARRLIRTPWITLFNVAAGKAIAPELVQEHCTGERLAAALAPLIDDPARRHAQAHAQSAALARMRGGIDDPSAAAADAVIRLLEAGQPRASSGA
jgi:lipid-A-disaccharide synthase